MKPDAACYEDYIIEYSQKLKAIGHPTRLRLLCLIELNKDPCVTDLWKCMKQPQPVISQHLSILKQNNIVDAVVKKTKRVYSIVDPFIRAIIREIAAKNQHPD